MSKVENIGSINEWVVLNNSVVDEKGNIKDLSKDKEAARKYFTEHVNKNTQYYHSVAEQVEYLAYDNNYWEKESLEQYSMKEIEEVFQIAYARKFRFPSYMSAFKFYNEYALRTDDKKTYLERYEDRLAINALYHADGNVELAKSLVKSLINQDFTPATPTLLNSGRARRGELVSCFLLSVNDSLNDISRALEFAMQLSKLGGGVSLDVTAIRAKSESIKGVEGVAKGVVGVLKLLDNAFRYADQMGQRQGAGAAYLNAFHADLEYFLDTKKINADDDIRLKTLSLGVVIPDKMMELAKEDKDMYQFFPHNVYEEYGVTFDEVAIDMGNWYDKLVENPNIKKKLVNPRKILEVMAALQGESGYPYVMFSDNVNSVRTHPIKTKFSNLCSEILQVNVISSYGDYGTNSDDIGFDISCNLASGNIVNMMEHKTIEETVVNAMVIMNSVSEKTNIAHVPGVKKANDLMHSVGLGMMNLHGYLAKNFIPYGSKDSLEFVDVFFNIVNYYSLKYSNEKARETGETYYQYEESTYATGEYFKNRGEILPSRKKVVKLFDEITIPSDQDWKELEKSIKEYGLYNSHRLAIAPTGSISYVLSSTASILPIKQAVEERTYGNSKTYYPMPFSDVAGFMYEMGTAYDLENRKIIDLVAVVQKHIDQGISFELCINSNYTTRDLKRDYIYAWNKGIKTVYYVRTNKLSVEQLEAIECLSCSV